MSVMKKASEDDVGEGGILVGEAWKGGVSGAGAGPQEGLLPGSTGAPTV